MRLVERRDVGADPVIHIGHRCYRQRDGLAHICRTWQAEWCYRGKQDTTSLRTRDESVAVERALGIRADLIDSRSSLVPSAAMRSAEPTLRLLHEKYLEYQRKRNHAPKTVEKYDLVLRELCGWARAAGVTRLANFTEESYWSFHAWMLRHGLSDKTRYDRLIVVKQAFKWAARTKIIPENPLLGADLIRKPATTPQPCFSPEQVARLLNAARGQTRAMFHVMAYAGLRFGEVRDLQWDDLLWDQGTCGFILICRGGANGTTKSGRHRRIPMHPRLRAVLSHVPRAGDRLFWDDAAEGSRVLERKLLFELKTLCRACGFPRPDQFKLHTFRHAFASMCARTNIAYKYALTWLGHRRSDVLDLYYQMFDPTAEEAIRTISYDTAPDPEYQI